MPPYICIYMHKRGSGLFVWMYLGRGGLIHEPFHPHFWASVIFECLKGCRWKDMLSTAIQKTAIEDDEFKREIYNPLIHIWWHALRFTYSLVFLYLLSCKILQCEKG